MNALPVVTVARLTATDLYVIACTACPDFAPTYYTRPVADEQAIDHRRRHGVSVREES